MALLANGLLPASYRGAPFAVLANDTGGGRRIALHQYPGRDEPWAEDMGRAARSFRFRGFIVDGDVLFAGGPIQLQRALLLAALEKAGSGLLVHPTLGPIQASVRGFGMGEDLGAGRMSSIEIEFVESGKRTFPSLLSGATGLLSAATLVTAGLAVDAVRAIALASSAGSNRADLSSTAALWSSRVVSLGGDATALHRLAAQMPGDYGRFSQGGNAGLSGSRGTDVTAAITIADLASAASAQRSAITTAAVALSGAIADAVLAYPKDLPTAVAGLVAALAAACADPADAIRLLLSLLAYAPPRAAASTSIGLAFGRLVKRAAAAALVTTVGDYQPTSADDAAALIAQVAGALDAVETDASDAGDDESSKALRTARLAIVQDLRRRGSTLAQVTTFTPGVPLPSVVLAQRYYRDETRAEQLEAQAAGPHPLFMPPSFQALAV